MVSVFNLVNIGDQVETFYNGPFVVQGAANTVNANFEAMQKSVFRAMSNEDLKITNDAVSDVNQAASNIQNQLPTIKQNFLGDNSIITRLEQGMAELAPMREQVLAFENKNAEAAQYKSKKGSETEWKVEVRRWERTIIISAWQ